MRIKKTAAPLPCTRQRHRWPSILLSMGLLTCLFLFSVPSKAQCAMCRAALESEGNTQKAQAVNDGIVYLMVIPYLLVGGIGYAVYRLNKKKKS